MGQTKIDGARVILLLVGVCLGMTAVATIALWSQWNPAMRSLVLMADILWISGASTMVLRRNH